MSKLKLASEEFHAHGYTFKPTFNTDYYSFRKTFIRTSGLYKVLFNINQDSFSKAPFPVIELLPEKVALRRLPHLLGGKYCCLFSDTSVIDPINIKQLISSWLMKMESIIDLWESGDYNEDYLAEFGLYWAGIPTYLLADNENLENLQLYEFSRQDLNANEVKERVVSPNIECAEKWAKNRNAISKVEYSNDATFVELACAPFIHYDHPWPPKTLKDFSEWLLISGNSNNNNIVLQRLLEALAKLGKWSKSSTFVDVIFHYEKEFFGVSFNLSTDNRKAIVNHFGPKSQRGRGKRAREKLRARIFENSRESIFQLNVIPSSPNFTIDRNLSAHSPALRSKNIALIGAGTIGGYLAHSLFQIGAGQAGGKLIIYDNDTLKVGNVGRHILGVNYLAERKSDALKHYIEKQGFSSRVLPEGKFSLDSDLSKFDVLIDATGDQAFSLNLSSKVSEYRARGGTIKLVHSWISGFGHTVKSLLDDGFNGCYACQFDYSKGGIKRELYPSFANGRAPEAEEVFKKSCGENHLPFGSEASMIAASLSVQLLSDRGKKEPTLLMRRMSAKAVELKDKKLKKRQDCPSCKN
jgi:molybdopterin/thiamine biosynthesis adenylyltransferase